MPITTTVGALGGFDIALVEHTPDHVVEQLGYFGHVVILDGRVDPTAAGDELLTAARYVGVLRSRAHPGGYVLGGSGMVFWLGSEDGVGHVIEAPVNLTNATLAQAVAAVLPPTVTLGTVHDPGGTYTTTGAKHQYQSPREALQIICDAFNVEFRVNGDGTVDVGKQADLYAGTPDTVIARRSPAGGDMDLRGLAGDFDVEAAAWDYSTKVLLLGQSVDDPDTLFATGSATAPVVPYKDLQGNPVEFTRIISESGETEGSVVARANLHLNRFNRVATSLKLTASDFDIEGNFVVGDNCYVHDPDTGIVDPAREVYFRGEVLHPDIVRVTSLTWGVRPSAQTVAFRTGDGVWLDLTPFVTEETSGSDELTIGDLPASLLRGDSTIPDRVDSVRTDNGVPPMAPTGFTLSTDSVIDAAGNNVAIITAEWVPPTQNSDGTSLTDLAHFLINWRQVGLANWQSTTTLDDSIDLPAVLGVDYEARVAAVDSHGDASAWTTTLTITAAVDAQAPPPPSDPTVGNYLGQLRIEWDGLDANGDEMPSDFNRVDVHVSATSGFTPTDATLVDSLATKGVSYATAPYGATHHVKFIAYDHNQNASAPSGQGSGSTQQVVSADVFNGAIGSAKLADLAVITAKIDNAAVNTAQVGSISVGKLTAGTMSADVTVSGRFTTALTGKRAGIDALGHFAYDASNNETVRIDGVDNLLTGKIKTARTGARIEIDNNGGLTAYALDGVTKNVVIFNRDELITPTGLFTGIWLEHNVGIRFQGTSSNEGAIGKHGVGDALQLRAAGDVFGGAGINLYEHNNKSGDDGDGDAYNGSIRFYTNQDQALKLLKDSTAVFRAGIRAPEMRVGWGSGGTAGNTTGTTFTAVPNMGLVPFVAPPSGVALVMLTIYLRSSSIGPQSQAGCDIRVGTTLGGGTLVKGAVATVVNGNTGWTRTTGTFVVDGMTPGVTHHARAMFRSDTSGSQVFASEGQIIVLPVM